MTVSKPVFGILRGYAPLFRRTEATGCSPVCDALI